VAHPVVSHEDWIAARQAFLAKEKEFTRLRDDLNAARRELPWEEVPEDHVFQGAEGPVALSELFGPHSQLIVYHFMYPTDWDAGCPHCSFWADNFDGTDIHLAARDTGFVAVSKAPYDKIAAYQKRMGWRFRWVSSYDNSFNREYGVTFTDEELASKSAFFNYKMQDPGISEREGTSAFIKDENGRMFHTYSAYARGIDLVNGAYNFLDLTAKGRDEGGRTQFWVRRHDEYAD
jgi:predicted dithiol-disulfide oxidoreductase (DUF899 family)